MSGNLYRADVLQLLDSDATFLLSQWSERLELDQYNAIPHEALVEAFRERQSLSRLLKQVREELRDEDISMIPFLLPYQKIHLRQRLVRAHYLTSLQARIDESEYRWDGLLVNQAYCARYESLIRAIDAPFYAREQDKGEQLHQIVEDSEKPMSWFGARFLVPVLSASMLELCAGNTTAVKNIMTEVDRKEVYIGWSRSFILSFFGLLPEFFSGDPNHLQSLRDAGVLLSYMNIATVNAAFAIECYLVLKNTFAGAFSTRHQHLRVDIWQQFSTQVYQRRFVLLNWFFLSFMHIAAFLCFSGFINVWPWGPFFSVSCRVIQLVLASARYRDEETVYHANQNRLLEQINDLDDLEKRLLYEISHIQDEDEKAILLLKLKLIEEDRRTLRYHYRKIKNDWMIKKDEFGQQSLLTTCFFVGVMMFTFLVIPTTIVAPPVGLAIGFAGAAVCIVFIISLSVMRTHFANERTRQDMLHMHQPDYRIKTVPDEQLDVYMRRFIELKALPESKETTLEMKQCYLRMQQLMNRSCAQVQILEHQRVSVLMTATRDILLPLVALSMLVFIPTPIGLGVIIGLVLLHFLVKKAFEIYRPLVASPLKFDEKAYQKFAVLPSIDSLASVSLKERKKSFSCDAQSCDDTMDDFTPDFGSLGI